MSSEDLKDSGLSLMLYHKVTKSREDLKQHQWNMRRHIRKQMAMISELTSKGIKGQEGWLKHIKIFKKRVLPLIMILLKMWNKPRYLTLDQSTRQCICIKDNVHISNTLLTYIYIGISLWKCRSLSLGFNRDQLNCIFEDYPQPMQLQP